MYCYFVYIKIIEYNFMYVSVGIEKILGFSVKDFCVNELKYVF